MGKNKRNNKQQQNKNKQPASAATTSSAATAAAAGDGINSSHNNIVQQKNNSSNNSKGNAKRLTGLSPQKRKEVNALILRLLDLASAATNNANEEWKQYVDMQEVLQRIMLLEAPLQSSAQAANADDDQTRLAKVAAFSEWAKAGGIQSDCLEIATFAGYELGLRATRDIEPDSPVLSVPRSMIFSKEHLNEADSQQLSVFPLLTNFNLTYALIIEKNRGTESRWHPYFEILPLRYNTVLYFSVEQMSRLRGTSACSTALRQCLAIVRRYAWIYQCALILPGPKMESLSALFTQHGLCYERYRWVVSTVMTRQNMVPRRELLPVDQAENEAEEQATITALIPYWDMANHKPGKITSYYDSSAHKMDCTAQEACQAGEQFFIYYGDRSNVDLLVHNGFVDVNNRKDYVNIKLGLSASDALVEQRACLLARLHIERRAELRVLPAPDYISGELLAFVRVFNMSAEQLAHWTSDLERAVDLLHIDCALETDHETRTWQYLYQRLKLLLGVLDANMREADAQQQLEALLLLETNNRPSKEQEIDLMILQYRRLERRILADALEYAQERCKA